MQTRFLLPSEKELYRAHLRRLPLEDRYSRFCSSIGDSALDHYLETIDFGRDRIKVSFDFSLNVVAAAHLSPIDAQTVEFSLSVERCCRNRGYGRGLFRSALAWMKSCGVRRAYCSCLRSNGAMLHLAISEGMDVAYDSGQADAYLPLDRADLGEIMQEILDQQIGWLDFTAKYLLPPNRLNYVVEKYQLAG